MSRVDPRMMIWLVALPFLAAMSVGVSSCALYEDVEPLDRSMAITDLEISPDPVRLELGQSTQASVTSFDRAGEPIGDLEVQWSSGNTSIATVDQNGRVGAQSVGDTTLTAQVGEVSAQVAVVVYTGV